MMRPVMMPDLGPAPDAPRPPGWFRRLAGAVSGGLRMLVAILLWRPWGKAPPGPLLGRLARGLVFRAAGALLALAVVALLLVYGGTHPRSARGELDPASLQLYYDPIAYLSADQTRLEGWLVPALDARRIVDQGSDALRRRHPAVVLVPGHGGRRQDMLPLISALHQRDMVVLVASLRGDERSSGGGATFGLREADDIQAAVDMLRRRPFVDPRRIAIIGSGSGANAALIAADRDESLFAVLEDPLDGFDDAARRFVLPQGGHFDFLLPACRLVFNIMYSADAGELDLARRHGTLRGSRILMLDRDERTFLCLTPTGIARTGDWLRERFGP